MNAPELVPASERKISAPLFSVVIRLTSGAEALDRAWDIAANLAGTLRIFQNPTGNELIPLSNEAYPYEEHVEDVVLRQSRRCGMLLNLEELTGFVHLPSCPAPIFSAGRKQTKAAPVFQPSPGSVILGTNEHLGQSHTVILSEDQRFRHLHVIGITGTGKSTLLFNLIRQDIEQGRGVGVLDPHGDLIDRILGIIPEERHDDVVLFDPADPDFTVGFNLLSARSDAEKSLLASDLVSVFQRNSTSWGDQMNSVLRNAVLAFLESSKGGTLLDLRRFLLEPGFREDFLATVQDTEVCYYWSKAFGLLSGNKSIGPILTRLDTFLSQKPIRHALAVQHPKLDFGNVMDSGKIFQAKLPQGLIGKENSFLLGSLLVGKFQQLAMARQGIAEDQRRPFHLVIDEFHHFITPTMAEILNGARKYRLSLTLAHHELHQLSVDKDVESALLSNAGTRIVFRVGDAVAKQLAEGFANFEASDLTKLEKGLAICRIDRPDHDFNLRVELPEYSPDAPATRNHVITRSRELYGTPRTEIESFLRQQLTVSATPEKPKPSRAKSPAKEVLEEPVAKSSSATPELLSVEIPPAPKPVTSLASTISEEKKICGAMGRGGPQHQDIQQSLREGAQALGFHVTVEKPTPDKQGSIDLALERGRQSIACKITVTTPIAHEVENARKCLEARYQHVVLISTEETRLEKLRQATASLTAAHPNRLLYFTPEQFLFWLGTLPAHYAVPELPTGERNILGYKVRSKGSALTDDERQSKESAALKIIGEAIKPKRGKNK